jgi:hypothetical protein
LNFFPHHGSSSLSRLFLEQLPEPALHCGQLGTELRSTGRVQFLRIQIDNPGAVIFPLETLSMKFRLRYFAVLLVSVAVTLAFAAKPPKPVSAKRFDSAAQAALAAMKSRAAELNIQGVAVVAFAPGDTIQAWFSQMAVVGHMTDHTNSEKGNNLLGIAYAKASEMANSLKDSGTSGKPPMTGEFGWQGGVVVRVPNGYIIVAFSGGKSEDDVQVSRAGLAILKSRL